MRGGNAARQPSTGDQRDGHRSHQKAGKAFLGKMAEVASGKLVATMVTESDGGHRPLQRFVTAVVKEPTMTATGTAAEVAADAREVTVVTGATKRGNRSA